MTETPYWACERAVELCNAEAARRGRPTVWVRRDAHYNAACAALARHIFEHEEPPADPDEETVRAILRTIGADVTPEVFTAAVRVFKERN